jgi:aryl-alcohol dehydrogenase-like predicted oxidoreductase
MEYRTIGNSELKASVVSIGGDTFGNYIDEEATARIIDRALELDINYIDTADAYGYGGGSETCIGKAVKGRRSKFIIASKFGVGVSKDDPVGRGGHKLGSRDYIMKAIDASLKRLDTDYLDLYQFHMPDPLTPMEETLRALDDLVKAGKVRYIGCSNLTAWELCEALWISKVAGISSFVSIQPMYNLLDRHAEEELALCCQAYNLGVIPWFPLAGGFLTGKYRRGEPPPPDSRYGKRPGGGGMFLSDANFDKLDKLEAFAKDHGHTMAELAIAWLVSHPWISTVIAGVTKPEQVTANVASAEWRLTNEEMAELDKLMDYRPYKAHPAIIPRQYTLPEGYVGTS